MQLLLDRARTFAAVSPAKTTTDDDDVVFVVRVLEKTRGIVELSAVGCPTSRPAIVAGFQPDDKPGSRAIDLFDLHRAVDRRHPPATQDENGFVVIEHFRRRTYTVARRCHAV